MDEYTASTDVKFLSLQELMCWHILLRVPAYKPQDVKKLNHFGFEENDNVKNQE